MESINKMKRQPTKWENILANYMTDKGLISKMCKQFIQLNIKNKTKTKESNLKMGRKPEYTFIQRRYTDGQQAYE